MESKAPSWVQVTAVATENGASESSEMERLLADSSPAAPDSSHDVEDVPNSHEPSVDANTTPSEPQKTPSEPLKASSEPQKARVAASGTAGCILGCLIGGPVCAILGGFGSAYAATNKEGAMGDCARSMGDVALATKSKAMEMEEKHQITQNTKQVAANAWENAEEMERQHHVCEKTKGVILYSTKTAVDFTVKHRLIERGAKGLGRGLEYVGEKLAGVSSTTDDADSEEETSSTPTNIGGAKFVQDPDGKLV
jgi:hypothetical protein